MNTVEAKIQAQLDKLHQGARVVGFRQVGEHFLLRVRAEGHSGSLRFRVHPSDMRLVPIGSSDRKHGGLRVDERSSKKVKA